MLGEYALLPGLGGMPGFGGLPPIVTPPPFHLPPAVSKGSLPAAGQQSWRSAPASPRSLSPLPGRKPHRGDANGAVGPQMGPAPLSRSASGTGRASSIKVVVRVRPLSEGEAAAGDREVAVATGSGGLQVTAPPVAAGASAKARSFDFHACLGPHVGQADVFGVCGVPQLVNAALRGYNVSVLAYGQTGSGKTYTMTGRESAIASAGFSSAASPPDGVVPRALRHLFAAVDAAQKGAPRGEGVQLGLSQVEIYNEAVYDLYRFTNKPLAVKWDASSGFYVDKAQVLPVASCEEALRALAVGMQHRHKGAHELNRESSRSHSIVTVHVASTAVDAATGRPVTRRSKLLFVDLAGSERLKATRTTDEGLKETGSINRSLFTLGKVIGTLGDARGGAAPHVPYRDSLLTKLLMDSIGGSALTLMVACVSPAESQAEQTLSTLAYAQKAKNIRNKPVVQVDHADAEILALQRELALLREENSYLRRHVSSTPGPLPAPLPPPRLAHTDSATPARPDSRSSEGGVPAGEMALLQSLSQTRARDRGASGAVAEEARGAVARVRGRGDAELLRMAREDLVAELRRATELVLRLAGELDEGAAERDRLRASRQLLALDHRGLAQENEQLRHKVGLLEALVRRRGSGGSGAPMDADTATTTPAADPAPGRPRAPSMGRAGTLAIEARQPLDAPSPLASASESDMHAGDAHAGPVGDWDAAGVRYLDRVRRQLGAEASGSGGSGASSPARRLAGVHSDVPGARERMEMGPVEARVRMRHRSHKGVGQSGDREGEAEEGEGGARSAHGDAAVTGAAGAGAAPEVVRAESERSDPGERGASRVGDDGRGARGGRITVSGRAMELLGG